MIKSFSRRYILLFSIGILICITVFIFVFLGQKDNKQPTKINDWTEVYRWAYSLGITTISDIGEANMDGPIYRKSAAKMMSVFAIKIFGRIPDKQRVCEFADIKKEISELQQYIRLSCQLGIMGLDYYGNPDDIFNPNYALTRDQLVTILSRIFFGDEYNINTGEITFTDKAKNFFIHSLSNIGKALGINLNISSSLDRYTKHLEAIKKLGVMTDYTPTIKEFRGNVMLIMYKLDQMGITKIKNLSEK